MAHLMSLDSALLVPSWSQFGPPETLKPAGTVRERGRVVESVTGVGTGGEVGIRYPVYFFVFWSESPQWGVSETPLAPPATNAVRESKAARGDGFGGSAWGWWVSFESLRHSEGSGTGSMFLVVDKRSAGAGQTACQRQATRRG
ncbi:MAG: hypothetical protein AB1898_32680 [Acidobacteriota bacterium]